MRSKKGNTSLPLIRRYWYIPMTQRHHTPQCPVPPQGIETAASKANPVPPFTNTALILVLCISTLQIKHFTPGLAAYMQKEAPMTHEEQGTLAHCPREKIMPVGRSSRTLVRLRTVLAVLAVLTKDAGEGAPVAAVLAAEREASRSRAASGGRPGSAPLRGRMDRSQRKCAQCAC